jgi:fatty-acyl-CoA synthase
MVDSSPRRWPPPPASGAAKCVAFLGFNSPEMLALLFACARLGALFMPLNWRLAAPEHLQMLQDCPPQVLIVEAAFLAQTDAIGDALAGHRPWSRAAAAPGWLAWDEFCARGTARRAAAGSRRSATTRRC